MFKIMDRGSYEKLSIRDSARSLKKYGSTSKHVNRNENCIKHYITHLDTLQGIALKYDVTVSIYMIRIFFWKLSKIFVFPYR